MQHEHEHDTTRSFPVPVVVLFAICQQRRPSRRSWQKCGIGRDRSDESKHHELLHLLIFGSPHTRSKSILQAQHIHKMIQRTLLRQSNVLKTRGLFTSSTGYVRDARSISATLPAPARARILSRWYSSTQDSAKEESAGTKEGEQATEDPKDKELAAKTKEVIDLKVCTCLH